MNTRTELTRNEAYRAYRFSPAYVDDLAAHAIRIIETSKLDGLHVLSVYFARQDITEWWESTAAFESHLTDIANGDRVLP